MSHRHFCDYASHDWECDGFALRSLAGDTEPSECYCLSHQVPMEDGDHSGCPVELLACPEHREQQLHCMGVSSSSNLSAGEGDSMFNDQDGIRIVGFCLWCGKDFYAMHEMEAHNAHDMEACPVFQEMKVKDTARTDSRCESKNSGATRPVKGSAGHGNGHSASEPDPVAEHNYTTIDVLKQSLFERVMNVLKRYDNAEERDRRGPK